MYFLHIHCAKCKEMPVLLKADGFCILHFAFFCILHFAFCILHFAFCILHFAFCILHFAFCILHFAFCILHFAFCILHFAFCILHFAFCILHFAFCILHFAFVHNLPDGQVRLLQILGEITVRDDGLERMISGSYFMIMQHRS